MKTSPVFTHGIKRGKARKSIDGFAFFLSDTSKDKLNNRIIGDGDARMDWAMRHEKEMQTCKQIYVREIEQFLQSANNLIVTAEATYTPMAVVVEALKKL